MKMATKMLLMRSGGDTERKRYEMNDGGDMRYRYEGGEMPRGMDEPESKFRDRRGREHYDDGRYAPMRNEMHGDRERRFEYTEKRNDYGDEHREPEMRTPYIPPYYSPEPQQRRIGFALEGSDGGRKNETGGNYRMSVHYPQMHEMEHRGGGSMEKGYADSKEPMPFTRETAEKWMRKLKNEDGTTGAHWPFEKTKQVMTQKSIDCDPVEFYAAMNMMYSDYAKVAKMLGMNTVDFYVEMAKAFLDDKDAGPGKIAKYYEYVVND